MVSPLNFEDKQKMLFDCLSTAENCIKGTSLEQKESNLDERQTRNSTRGVSRRFHGKESIFKRPAAPISKCLKPRRAPDYQVNPHKWKKYSLDDADISDRTNTSAAFAFLSEIEKRKDLQANDEDMDDSSGKIKFKTRKSAQHKNLTFSQSVSLRAEVDKSNEGEIEEKPILKGSKVLMPEYVIGQKNPNKKKRSLATSSSSKKRQETDCKERNKPQLQHLFENEDQDDDITD